MDFSMIFTLIWKIVLAVLKKEGVLDDTMNLELPGTGTSTGGTTVPTTPTTPTTPTEPASGGTGSSLLDGILSKFF